MDEISKRAYEFGPFRLEVRRRRLWREGELLAVPSKAIDTLVVLVQHPWEMVRRQDLVTIVWAEAFVEDSNLTVAISQLRKALGKNEGDSDYIEAISRIGSRLADDVRE